MRVHFLGIAGTFMANLAILAQQLGMEISGQDSKCYYPMNEMLAAANIKPILDYAIDSLPQKIDLMVIGNVMCRGMPIVEWVLDNKIPYVSGPEFLQRYIIKNQHMLVVTGTHGKTTTSSMLAWILQYAKLEPGFLIGGVANNFKTNVAYGAGKYFVIEGDEYDCAFFAKHAKFLHYNPRTLIINNLEYDHADIYPNLEAIQQQFHYLVRQVPSSSTIIVSEHETNVQQVLAMGVWSKIITFTKNTFDLSMLSLCGSHNYLNAQAALLAALDIGVPLEIALTALSKFTGVKRRLEYLGGNNNVKIYDDFAHHPTAIRATIDAIRSLEPNTKICALVELGSNTMKLGVHNKQIPQALEHADQVYLYTNQNTTSILSNIVIPQPQHCGNFTDPQELLSMVHKNLPKQAIILLLSNGAFGGLRTLLIQSLNTNCIII